MIESITSSTSFLLFGLMAFIGMPHGAADILLLFRKFGMKKTIVFSFAYFIFFIFGMIVWNWRSDFFLFLLWPASFFHFIDVEKKLKGMNLAAFEDVMFFTLFTLPLLKAEEFNHYLVILDGSFFYSVFILLKWPIYIVQVFLSVFVLYRNFKLSKYKMHLSVYAVTLAMVLCFNLLINFTVLFIFIHSLRHLYLSFIKNYINIKNYFYILLPISILSIGTIYFFRSSFTRIQGDNIFLMVGLGALAFPHLLVESLLKDKN